VNELQVYKHLYGDLVYCVPHYRFKTDLRSQMCNPDLYKHAREGKYENHIIESREY